MSDLEAPKWAPMLGVANRAVASLGREGLEASEWGNGPGDRYPAHRHGYDKVLVCVEGGIEFWLRELSRVAALEPGDRLDLPSNTWHEAVVGRDGVRCLEAHLPAGTLPRQLLHRPGWALTAD
ncbi:MAG: cupin domain-containing protein [Candidatus Limnocylindrales bacterium]